MQPNQRVIVCVDVQGYADRYAATRRRELYRILESSIEEQGAGRELAAPVGDVLSAPVDRARAFLELLLTLWRWAEPASTQVRVLRMRTVPLPAAVEPNKPPGRLVVASGHVARGPNPRMTSALVVREERPAA